MNHRLAYGDPDRAGGPGGIHALMPWPPMLAATAAAVAVAVAVARTILITLGPRVARQQKRERRAEQNQRVRPPIGYRTAAPG